MYARKRKLKNIFRLAFSLFFIISAANGYPLGEEAPKEEGLITIYKGELKAIAVDNPTRVVISNPQVADVTSISKDEMLIVATEAGTTNLTWWDSRGEHVSQLRVFLENMSPVKERIDDLLKEINLPGVFTSNMDSEGKVLLLGTVKTPQDIERINTALGSLKEKAVNLVQVKEEEAVVGIDVQVLELNKDATATLGFSWPSTITLTETGSPAIATAGTKWSSLFKVLNLSRAAFTWTLDLLVQEGKARILSQPRLSCQSGKEAELLVGGEKPILTTTVAATTGAQGTNVEYKEFGIKLKIKPTVTEDKKIKLALNVEVSEVVGTTAEFLGTSTNATAKAWPLTKRTTATELYLNDGQTMAIGGLKKQKSEEDIRKTPFLGDAPILGLFFRKKTKRAGGGQGERGDVELFITLTPTIIKEGVKKEAVSEYVRRVSQQIRRSFVYPWAAKAANLEGSLKLGLRLYYTGQLLDVEIRESSGSALLDENALNIVKTIAPYPPFPPQMKQKELWIDLPIIYKRD